MSRHLIVRGACDICEKVVEVEVPPALMAEIGKAGASKRIDELENRIQVVLLRLHGIKSVASTPAMLALVEALEQGLADDDS